MSQHTETFVATEMYPCDAKGACRHARWGMAAPIRAGERAVRVAGRDGRRYGVMHAECFGGQELLPTDFGRMRLTSASDAEAHERIVAHNAAVDRTLVGDPSERYEDFGDDSRYTPPSRDGVYDDAGLGGDR